MNKFSQCKLVRKTPTGHIQNVAWIPSKFAIQGNFVKIKNNEGDWVNGWKVEVAGSSKIEEKHLPDWHKGVRGHRNSTGDSLTRLE